MRRDDRDRAVEQRPQHLGEHLGVGAVLLPGVAADLAHEGEVGAGAEGLAAAAEDDRAHAAVFVAASAANAVGELADEDAVERVAHVGPVEPDAGDRAGSFDAKRGGGHGAVSLLSACSIMTMSSSGGSWPSA